MNSRYLLYEAQNAHYYGLPENLAIASVTSTPAKLLGLGHRVGYVKEGEWSLSPPILGQVFLMVVGLQVGMQVRNDSSCASNANLNP